MSEVYYKAVRPNGASFHDPEFRWLPMGWQSGDPIPADWVVRHPNPGRRIGKGSGAWAGEYLSIATVPTDCTNFQWPCALLEVEAVGRACLDDRYRYPNKRRVRAARVIQELPAHEVFGPQGREVVAILDRTGRLTAKEVERLSAAWGATRDATRDAAWNAPWDAARKASRNAAWNVAWSATRDATRDAAWNAAGAVSWDAAAATLARDLIPAEQYDVLMAPWLAVMGDE